MTHRKLIFGKTIRARAKYRDVMFRGIAEEAEYWHNRALGYKQ